MPPEKTVINSAGDTKGMEVTGNGQQNTVGNIPFHDLFHIMGDQITIIDIQQMTTIDTTVKDVVSRWWRSKYCLESG